MIQTSWEMRGWLPLKGRWLRYAGVGLVVAGTVVVAFLGFMPAPFLALAAAFLVLAEGEGQSDAAWPAFLAGGLSGWVIQISTSTALALYGQVFSECGTYRSLLRDQVYLLAPLVLVAAVLAVRSLAPGPLRSGARVALLTAMLVWIGAALGAWAL